MSLRNYISAIVLLSVASAAGQDSPSPRSFGPLPGDKLPHLESIKDESLRSTCRRNMGVD